MGYRLPEPPAAGAVVGDAAELVDRGRASTADALIERAVHAGTRPADLLAAALALGAERERERRRRADALAAKAARIGGRSAASSPADRPGDT